MFAKDTLALFLFCFSSPESFLTEMFLSRSVYLLLFLS